MIRKYLDFESKRIRNNPSLNLGAVIILILTLLLALSGAFDYLSQHREIENFKNYEREKISNYVNWDQYGGYGFKMQVKFSPLLLFSASSSKYYVESTIDNKETISVDTSKRGKARFRSGNNFLTPWGIVPFFSILLSLYSGFSTFSSALHIDLYSKKRGILLTILARLILILMYFLYLSALAFLVPLLAGVSFSLLEVSAYTLYSVYFVGIIAFAFLTGVILNRLITTGWGRSKALKIVIIVWLFFLIVPYAISKYIDYKANKLESIYRVNLHKLRRAKLYEKKSLAAFEKLQAAGVERKEIYKFIIPEYLDKVYPSNLELETKYIEAENELADLKENLSLIFPTIYLDYMAGEISSDGQHNNSAFLNRIIRIKGDFLRHYFYKKYFAKDKSVVPFLLDSSFEAIVHIPDTLPIAFIILFGYILFISTTFPFLIHKPSKGQTTQWFRWEIKPGAFFFFLMESKSDRHYILNSMSDFQNLILVRKIEPSDMDLGLEIKHLIDYICFIRDIDKSTLVEYIKILGIPTQQGRRHLHITKDHLKKIYLASSFCLGNAIVIDDFVKDETKDFDFDFASLVNYALNVQHKSILYISADPYTPRKRSAFLAQSQAGKICEVEPNLLSLR